MIEYSENYYAAATATTESDDWRTESQGEFEIGVPPESDGPAPESHYMVALINCYIATFRLTVKSSNCVFNRIVGNGVLHLRPDGGDTTVESCDLTVELHAPDKEKGRRVLQKT